MSPRSVLGVASACVVLAGCASSGDPVASESKSSGAVNVPATSPAPETEARTGPLVSSSIPSCVEDYAAQGVARRGFAFDGTVVNIADGTTNRPGKGRIDTAGVTFAVNTWYVGGPTSKVTIDMAPPGGGPRPDEVPPTYEVGTRLLVSGESRWGEGVLLDGLAWGCGFTRYHDAGTADEWHVATS